MDLFLPIPNSEKNRKAYDDVKGYDQGDTVFYQGTLWHAKVPTDAGTKPQSVFSDQEDDGERNNPWRPAYPWKGGEELLIRPHKLFVDGDNWFSDMSKLGQEVCIPDTLCLDSIKVVPNPYKAIGQPMGRKAELPARPDRVENNRSSHFNLSMILIV